MVKLRGLPFKLTQVLVFSTLHTNDATGAFTRLIDMGTEPFLVADAIEAIMAQRLVRRLCEECKTEQDVDRDYLLRLDFPKIKWIKRDFGTVLAVMPVGLTKGGRVFMNCFATANCSRDIQNKPLRLWSTGTQ